MVMGMRAGKCGLAVLRNLFSVLRTKRLTMFFQS